MKLHFHVICPMVLTVWLEAMAGGDGFVVVEGKKMFLDGKPYFYCGTNFWYGMNLASLGPGGDRDRLNRELDALVLLGIRNLRVMAGSEGPADEPQRMLPPLQTEPGVYDPDVLDGLDYLLYAMDQRGLRAVMCLNNFWQWSGGMAQYVRWNGGSPIPYPPPWDVFMDYSAGFYTNTGAVADFNGHIRFIVNRLNPYSGLAYRDDPAVMAWELANEPRGQSNAEAMNLWIDETAALIKSLDSNHLVTTGCEGFDFIVNHDGVDIDYATIHIWPQNWGWYNPWNPYNTFGNALASATDFFNDHAVMAAAMNKPLVLEEFGMARDNGSFDPATTTSWKDQFFQVMFDLVHQSALSGGPACGDNFWAWAGEGRPKTPYGSMWQSGDEWIGDPPHEQQGWYSVYDTDSTTLAKISGHAASMNQLGDDGVADPSRVSKTLISLQAFPSPFREDIIFAANLPPRSRSVVLEISDMLGRMLFALPMEMDRLTYRLSGSDFVRAGASSGVYVARLRWETGSVQIRFVWMK